MSELLSKIQAIRNHVGVDDNATMKAISEAVDVCIHEPSRCADIELEFSEFKDAVRWYFGYDEERVAQMVITYHANRRRAEHDARAEKRRKAGYVPAVDAVFLKVERTEDSVDE